MDPDSERASNSIYILYLAKLSERYTRIRNNEVIFDEDVVIITESSNATACLER